MRGVVSKLDEVPMEKSSMKTTGKPVFDESNPAGGSAELFNILLIAHKFLPFIGGIEMHTFEVGRRMAARGHNVRVLTGDPTGALPREEIVAGMRVTRVPVYPKSSDAFFAPELYHEVLQADTDIIHVQGFHTFVPPIAQLAAIRKKAPFVMTFHSGGHSSNWRNLIRGAQREVLRPLIKRADKLIGVSEFEADLFSRTLRIPREKFTVVPNGAEIEPGDEMPVLDPASPLIVTIGRLERYKGHHRVVRAFAELLKTRPAARLRVLGEGPYKQTLVDTVHELGIEDHVTIGGIPPEDRQHMANFLAGASAVVLLSDYEAHPVAALEAISLGRAVLASNSTGFVEMAAKGLLRTIDPDAPPAEIARAVLDLIDRPPRRPPNVEIANWDDCASNLLDIYRAVIIAARSGLEAKPAAPLGSAAAPEIRQKFTVDISATAPQAAPQVASQAAPQVAPFAGPVLEGGFQPKSVRSNKVKSTSLVALGLAAGFVVICADGRPAYTPAMAGQESGAKRTAQVLAEQAAPAAPVTSVPAYANAAATSTISPSQDCTPKDAADPAGASGKGVAIGRGDKIKMSFYEVLPTQDGKWGGERQQLKEPAKAFQLRAELSAEYIVQDDGAVAIPMLGQFNAAGHRTSDFQRQVECAFDAFLGRKGFVNVLSVVNPPIYVIGQIKNAGSYDYTPGMTVLHAVALAGGFDKAPVEPWVVAELTRETERLQTALDRAMRMMARSTAIEAARTTGRPAVPAELANLAGKEKAKALVYNEFAPRRAEMQALASDEASMKGAVESASAEMELQKARLPILNQSIELRKERVANLNKLMSSGTIARPVVIQAQTELMEVQDRNQQTLNSLNLARDRYNQARQQLQARQDQAEVNSQKDASEARAEATIAAGESDAAANVLRAMARTRLSTPASLDTEFVIVRRQGDGVAEFSATGTTVLQPGDLVQARTRPATNAN
jgi:glycosyltransferase involved in cell wall biosynthesis/protein involved in polysaccharide export with SLBB domain